MSASGQLPLAVYSRVVESALRDLASPGKACSHFLAAVRDRLAADAAWLVRPREADSGPAETVLLGDPGLLDPALIEAFGAERRPVLPRHLLLAPLRLDGRRAGVVGVGRRGRDFALGEGRVLNRLVRVLAADLARRGEERLQRILDRVQSKVVFELRPRDLAYQIFDALHQLVHYDHSVALLVYQEEAAAFRVEAEKVVWTKAKSAFVGHEVPVAPALLAALARDPDVRLYPLGGGDGPEDLFLPLARYHQGHGIPEATSALFAPLFHGGELLGMLKVAAYRRPPFQAREAAVVRRFLPMARLSLRNARLRSTLEAQALDAEIRASLVTLARAVAHDVNGAVGAILLLAEQLREEAAEGRLDAGRLCDDLDAVLAKARLCKRIFSNMLRVGVGRAGSGPVDLNQVIRDLLPMLEAQLGPRPIRIEARLAEPMAAVEASRLHLEHIVWNLVTNAVEAMANRSGSIELVTRDLDAERVALAVTDDGPGMPPEVLDKVQEPFFSTKPGGTGLGLAICRSLAWQYGGSLELRSAPGRGTRVEVSLPKVAGA